MQLDDQTHVTLDAFKASRDAKRRLAIQLLRELGVDVRNWLETEMVMREWRAMREGGD